MSFPLLVFYRNKQWDVIADFLRVDVKHALNEHAKFNEMHGSYSYKRSKKSDNEYEAIKGPAYFLSMFFQLQDKQASDAVLKHLGTFPEFGRVDNSALVMDLINTDPTSFFWALENGWGKSISLLTTRQHKLKWHWNDIVKVAIEYQKTDTLDEWLRLWSKRNLSMQRIIQAPTMAECQWCVCKEGILPGPVLQKLLQQEPNLALVIESWKVLGCWDAKTSEAEKAALVAKTISWLNNPITSIDAIEGALFDFDLNNRSSSCN